MTPADGQRILAENFAPWVQALGLRVEQIGDGEATLRLPFDARLVRIGGTVCGQALMASADTAMVIAISAALGAFRPMATVSQNVSFFRPVADKDVLLTARVLKAGKTLVFGDIAMHAEGSADVSAHATTTYAISG